MKRLKTKYGYHEALIKSVEYIRDEDVYLELDLSEYCSGLTGATVHLIFTDVKNLSEVRDAFERLRNLNLKERGYIAEIVAIGREQRKRYFVGVTTEDITIEASGMVET